MALVNASIGKNTVWAIDGMTYEESIVQEYANMRISAGLILDGVVEGHERNTCYLRLQHDEGHETFVLLTDDEMAAVAWCASGVLWSRLMSEREDTDDETIPAQPDDALR